MKTRVSGFGAANSARGGNRKEGGPLARNELSSGGILYTEQGGRRLYVLVEERDGHFGLPKGHVEPGETLRQTALREIREETGIRPALLPYPPVEEKYDLPSGGKKRVIYYYCRFFGQTPVADTTQVNRVRLCPYSEAVALLTFEGARRVLRVAEWTLNHVNRA